MFEKDVVVVPSALDFRLLQVRDTETVRRILEYSFRMGPLKSTAVAFAPGKHFEFSVKFLCCVYMLRHMLYSCDGAIGANGLLLLEESIGVGSLYSLKGPYLHFPFHLVPLSHICLIWCSRTDVAVQPATLNTRVDQAELKQKLPKPQNGLLYHTLPHCIY